MFGLLSLIEKTSADPATNSATNSAQNYRNQIKKIANTKYDEKIASLEPLMSDITFEAEAFYGADQKNWDNHMKELILNFEEDVISQELITSMNEMKLAEKAKDVERVTELAKKSQVLSIRKAEVGKKRRK